MCYKLRSIIPTQFVVLLRTTQKLVYNKHMHKKHTQKAKQSAQKIVLCAQKVCYNACKLSNCAKLN